jgi:hypothetical protein
VCLVGTSACAPSLATMQPARTVPAGHLQITSSADVTVTSGPIRDAIDDLGNVEGGRMSRADLELAADAASVALIQPPSIGYQVSVAYGLTREVEIGVRTSMSAVRGWTRYQFLRTSPGIYGAVGVGVAGYLYAFPIHQFHDGVRITEYGRWDVDVPLSFGFSSRAFHVWAGPKLMLSDVSGSVEVCVDQETGRCSSEADVSLDALARYVAGQVGIAFGWTQFFVAAELTVARVETDATVSVTHAGVAEEQDVEADGIAISPAVGFILWI